MILEETKLAAAVLDGEEETPAPESSGAAEASATALDGEEKGETPAEGEETPSEPSEGGEKAV